MQNEDTIFPVSSRKTSFIVLKQKNGGGPVYKIEVCSRTLQVLSKELLQDVPPEWTLDDFYSMWDEGRRINIDV
jgi:hypothetical protein